MSHRELVKQAEPIYRELDFIFDELRLKRKKEVINKNRIKWKIPETETVEIPNEKSESSTMTPFKRRFPEISAEFGVKKSYGKNRKRMKGDKHKTFPKV